MGVRSNLEMLLEKFDLPLSATYHPNCRTVPHPPHFFYIVVVATHIPAAAPCTGDEMA